MLKAKLRSCLNLIALDLNITATGNKNFTKNKPNTSLLYTKFQTIHHFLYNADQKRQVNIQISVAVI